MRPSGVARALRRARPLGPALALSLGLLAVALPARAQSVRITTRPAGLVYGRFDVAVAASAPVERLALFVNGVHRAETSGRQLTVPLDLGLYIRRLRVRAVGYDAHDAEVGEDEIVLDDPRPPFRVRLQGPLSWPAAGSAELAATVLAPAEMRLTGVELFVGEEKVATLQAPPWTITVDGARFPGAAYARVVAHAANGQEANDVWFFGEHPHAIAEVSVQQIPLSVIDGDAPLTAADLRVEDDGQPRRIETLVPAADQPLHVILLIDYSESMIEELPVVKAAARELAQKLLLRPQDGLAVVGFNQQAFWLTDYTSDPERVARAVERMKPMGATHLYDSTIEALYDLQKTPGRHALVVFTDGADQGSRFQLDHLVHYARYAGVPIYPVIKNRVVSRWAKLGLGRLLTHRIAQLAEDTGATWFLIQRERELGGVYERIARELRQQYELVFEAEAGMPDQWRALRVTSASGRRLRAPMGYFP